MNASPDARLHLEHWPIIRSRIGLLILIFLLALGSAGVITYLTPKDYTSSATIEVQPDKNWLPSLKNSTPEQINDPKGTESQFQIIVSHDVLDPVITALTPSHPKTSLNLALGALAGVVLGPGLVFFRKCLDRNIKTPPRVEKRLGLPLLAVIPKASNGLPLTDPEDPDEEPYRILKTSVDLARKRVAASVLAVVSGASGEGKSTIVRTKSDLQNVGTKILGLVLNNADVKYHAGSSLPGVIVTKGLRTIRSVRARSGSEQIA